MSVNILDGESVSTSVLREFGGKERRFELRLGEIKKLEQATGAGIGEVYTRVASLRFTLADVRDTIKLGLVGGSDGMIQEADAEGMVRAFVDGWPMNEGHALASAILLACFVGVDTSGNPAGLKKDQGAAPATSAPSTEPARQQVSILETSIA